ncbi:MAG: SIMPL domain-containing protein [Chloroflexi bacterium]|nr:SIMPL domain-containing protein [Chloroflexota bacterium]
MATLAISNPLRVITLATLAVLLSLSVSMAAFASGPVAAPQAAPASEGPFITAIGTGVVPPSSTDFISPQQTLYISAQSVSGPDDIQKASDEMQARLVAIRGALEKLGVPLSGVHFTYLNVNPQFGAPQPGSPSPVEKGQPLPQTVTRYTIDASMTADIPSVKLLVPAMNAATQNGATRVNVSAGGKGYQPSSFNPAKADLDKAMADAVEQARSSATSMATATGKKLGEIQSVSAMQPMPDCCPPNTGWRVQVTVTFKIAP